MHCVESNKARTPASNAVLFISVKVTKISLLKFCVHFLRSRDKLITLGMLYLCLL